MTTIKHKAKATQTTAAKKPPAKAPAPAKGPAPKPAPKAPARDTRTQPAPQAYVPPRFDFGRLNVPPMAQDNTRVVRHIPTFEENQARSRSYLNPMAKELANMPAPRQTYLSQAPNYTPAERRQMEANTRRIEAQEQAQRNINGMAQLDPFAAGVNGYHNMGTDRNPDWQKVSPSPLEFVATNFGAGGKIVGAVLTTQHVVHAVEHPSIATIGEATVSVLGTVAGVKHPHGSGVVARTLRGAHTVHQGSQLLETTGVRKQLTKAGGGGE